MPQISFGSEHDSLNWDRYIHCYFGDCNRGPRPAALVRNGFEYRNRAQSMLNKPVWQYSAGERSRPALYCCTCTVLSRGPAIMVLSLASYLITPTELKLCCTVYRFIALPTLYLPTQMGASSPDQRHACPNVRLAQPFATADLTHGRTLCH